MRISQHMANAAPPPATAPRSMAMVGLVSVSSRPAYLLLLRSYWSASSGVENDLNCEMSVPETKALSPAPVRISTLTLSSCSTCSQQSYSPSYMAQVRALRACGRLNVSRATAPRRSYRSSSVFGTNSVAGVVAIRQSLTRIDTRHRWLADRTAQGKLKRQRWRVENHARVHDALGIERVLESAHDF